MKYTISVNQKAIIENGYNIDLTEAALLDWLYSFIHSGKMKELRDGGHFYYWVNYEKVLADMPILKATTKDAIYRRFKRLTEEGFIIPHPDNQRLGNPYYRINNEKFYRVHFSDPSENNPYPFGNSSDEGTERFPNNNSISDSSISKGGQAPSPSQEEKEKNTKKGFCKKVIQFVKNNPNKYPKALYMQFCEYWLEKNEEAGKLRFQEQKYFEVGRRLSLWFQKAGDAEIGRLWAMEQETKPLNVQLIEKFNL